MEETPENKNIDLERFGALLREKTEDYARESYITYTLGQDPEINRIKKENAEKLYREILDQCAEALLKAEDKKMLLEIITKTFVNYMHGNGYLLVEDRGAEFYHDLILRLAEKVSEKIQ